MKKTSLILIIAMLVTALTPAIAFGQDNTIVNDKENIDVNIQEEVLNIEGKDYQYSYEYTTKNDIKAVYVKDLETGIVDIITEKSGVLYLNGNVAGKIETIEENIDFSIATPKASMWTNAGSGSRRITWAAGTGTAAVAGMIAIALGSIATPGAVIAAMGTGVLGVIAAASTGGTVTYTLYTSRAGQFMRYKWNWRFRASTGDSYGPYNSYVTV